MLHGLATAGRVGAATVSKDIVRWLWSLSGQLGLCLASDRKEQREDRVRRYIASDPGVALLLAAVNFEWTVCRAVLFLSRSQNADLRIRLGKCYGLDAYKELWKTEVASAPQLKPLKTAGFHAISAWR
jgi:hypothetical protein